MRGAARAVLALGLAAALAAPAAAEVRRLEVVGVAPAGADAPRGGRGQTERDVALASAIAEAVERVAGSRLPGGAPPDLARRLGDPRAYAVRYRILEDRGERRALLIRDPRVTRERVLLVEVHVDVDRVERRLTAQGLLGGFEPGSGNRLEIVLEDVSSWSAYARLREALEQAGARGSVPVAVRPGRMLLELEAPGSPRRLVESAVAAARAEGLDLRLLAVEGSRFRLELR